MWLWTETNYFILKIFQELPSDKLFFLKSSSIFRLENAFMDILNNLTNAPVCANKIREIVSIKYNSQQQKSSYSENLRKADFDTDVLDYADEFCKDLNIEKIR